MISQYGSITGQGFDLICTLLPFACCGAVDAYAWSVLEYHWLGVLMVVVAKIANMLVSQSAAYMIRQNTAGHLPCSLKCQTRRDNACHTRPAESPCISLHGTIFGQGSRLPLHPVALCLACVQSTHNASLSGLSAILFCVVHLPAVMQCKPPVTLQST